MSLQVRLWEPNAANGGVLPCAQLEPSHAGVVRALCALSVDTLASASDDRTARVWCAAVCGSFPSDDHNNAYFVSRNNTCEVRFLDFCSVLDPLDCDPAPASRPPFLHRCLRERKCKHTLRGHKAEVLSAAGLPGGLLATGGAEGATRLWDWRQGQPLVVLMGALRWPRPGAWRHPLSRVRSLVSVPAAPPPLF